MRRVACALAVALLLGGCDTIGSKAPSGVPLPPISTELPRYGDPLAGLYPLPATNVRRDLRIDYYAPGRGTGKARGNLLTMALVPGANYHKLRDYLARAGNDAKVMTPGSAGTVAYDLRLQPVLARAVEIVKQRYPWIEITDSVAAAAKRHTSLILVLDIRSRLGRPGGDPTAVQVEVIAFDHEAKPIARFLGEGQVAAGGSAGYGFQQAAKEALDELETKSKTYFN